MNIDKKKPTKGESLVSYYQKKKEEIECNQLLQDNEIFHNKNRSLSSQCVIEGTLGNSLATINMF